MFSDLDQITRRIERLEKDLKKKADPVLANEQALLQRCQKAIEGEKPLRELEFTPEETKTLTGYMFLSQRPMLYVLNLGDEEVGELASAIERHHLEKLVGRPRSGWSPFADASKPNWRSLTTLPRRKCSRPTSSRSLA